MFEGTSRFEVQRELGSGGFGTVYQAFDHLRECPVALKVLHRAEADALVRFKNEFRVLADITHPNLVGLYELHSEKDTWFFTMELIQSGIDITTHVRRSGADTGQTPADCERVRDVLRQLADGLSFLHSQGKLHHDIKPANVLVTAEGRVVILDFGLVSDVAETGADVAGTPAYMPPEKLLGEPVTQAGDWHTVGLLLHEMLVGSPPYAGDPATIMLAKMSDPLEPPSAFVSGVPEDLDKLCAALLANQPEKRPSGEEILRGLGVESKGSPVPSVAFIGRDVQLGILRAALEEVRQRKTAVVGIRGLSGMGKSALVQHFVNELRGVLPLSAKCYEQEAVPYKAIDGLVDALTRHLRSVDTGRVASLLPPDVHLLAQLFPVLASVKAIEKAPRTAVPDPVERRRRAGAAFKQLLGNVAKPRTLLLIIDDLQWGDSDSADLLAELLRPPDSPPCLLLYTYRSDELARSTCLQSFVEGTLRDSDLSCSVYQMEVGPLSQEDAESLLDGVDRTLAANVVAESGGSPFFLLELGRYATQTGRPDLNEALRQRVAELPASARRLLEVVAVAGMPLSREVARASIHLEDSEPATVSALRSRRLLRVTEKGEELDTWHDRIREAVMGQLGGDERCTLHRALAVAGEGRADSEWLAGHYRAAGEKSRALEHTLAAARRADEALAFARAASLYRLALQEGVPEPRTVRLRLAHCLANDGWAPEAAGEYLNALDGASSVEQVDLRRRASEQYIISGHIPQAMDVMRDVLPGLGLKLAETPQQALLSLLKRRVQLALRGYRFKERSEDEVDEMQRVRLDTYRSLLAVGQIDVVRHLDIASHHLLLALESGDIGRVAFGFLNEAYFLAGLLPASHPKVQGMLDRARTLAARANIPSLTATVRWGEGVIACTGGDFPQAIMRLKEAERSLREDCTDMAGQLSASRMMLLALSRDVGHLHELSERSQPMLRESRDRGNRHLEAWAIVMGGYQKLAADRPATATDGVNEAVAGSGVTEPYGWLCLGHLLLLCDVALYSENGRLAMQHVDGQWIRFRRSGLSRASYARFTGYRIRGRSALSAWLEGSQPGRILRQAEAVAAAASRDSLPPARGCGVLLQAGLESVHGRLDRAVVRLAEAESVFESCGMVLDGAAAKMCRGDLLGGDEGHRLVAAAEAAMRDQGVQNPHRWRMMAAPGRWRS